MTCIGHFEALVLQETIKEQPYSLSPPNAPLLPCMQGLPLISKNYLEILLDVYYPIVLILPYLHHWEASITQLFTNPQPLALNTHPATPYLLHPPHPRPPTVTDNPLPSFCNSHNIDCNLIPCTCPCTWTKLCPDAKESSIYLVSGQTLV
jgi:hypothetical protein